jgi:hypothetical protein
MPHAPANARRRATTSAALSASIEQRDDMLDAEEGRVQEERAATGVEPVMEVLQTSGGGDDR